MNTAFLEKLQQGAEKEITARNEQQMQQEQQTAMLPAAPERSIPRSLAGVHEKKREFLWYPYIPKAEYTVIFAESGIGKSFACLAVAAARSRGEALPGETDPKPPGNTLYITSEDDAEDLKGRLRDSGADFSRIYYLDRESSLGMDFSPQNIGMIREHILRCKAELVIVDPWQAFVGEKLNTNAQPEMRAVLQRISVLAKQTGCAIILVSHVNKRERRENINNAATGSGELINACRSAITIQYENGFTEETRSIRLLIHTKSSHAAPGKTVRYDLNGGTVKWAGFSDIDRWTVDYAAANKMNLQEAVVRQRRSRRDFSDLKRAILQLATRIPEGKTGIRVLYSEIEDMSGKGEKVWNAPADVKKIDKSGTIAAVKCELFNDYSLSVVCETTKAMRSDLSRKVGKCVLIQRVEET